MFVSIIIIVCVESNLLNSAHAISICDILHACEGPSGGSRAAAAVADGCREVV